MHLTCSQKDLASALGIVSKAVDGNNTLPVLNNVLVRAEGDTLYFTSTNLELTISYSIGAQVRREGEITIPAKLLTSYVGYLRDSQVEIEVDNTDIHIKTPDSKTKIKGIAATEFPPIPRVEEEVTLALETGILKKAIGQVVFAAAINTTRPILGGVYFGMEGEGLKMVSTDSYRLSEKALSTLKISGELNCVIPARTILELGSILEVGSAQEVEMVAAKNQVMFTVGRVQLISCLIEGQFPNYKQIIPESSQTQVEFELSELSLALKRISIFARENNNKIVFKIGDGEVLITTESTQYGEGEVVLKPLIQGKENAVALNVQFLLESLGHLASSKVVMEVGDEVSPVMLRAKEDSDYLHIIMPLKI